MKNLKELWNTLPKNIRISAIIAALLVVVAVLSVGKKTTSVDQAAEGEQPTFTVKRGPLTINVIESGTIKAREQVVIKNEVEGRTNILWLIEEGTIVKEGELLIELDVIGLKTELLERQIKTQNSEAAFIRARENLDVVKNQADSDVDKAELNLMFAKQDLQTYLKGEYPKELKEAESKITLAREELQRAEEKLKWSKVLFKEKYISQTELQADELAANKTRLNLELAQESLKLLKEYTYPRKIAELESEVKQTTMAEERTRRKAAADVVQAEAELRAKDLEHQHQLSLLEKVKNQITKTKIYAPSDGLVIYATTARGGWRGNAEPLAAGQEVKERQELIYLPKTASVLAEVKVHESSLDKVKVGLPVTVTVDALPGRVYAGKVASISPLPDATSMWFNPDLKLYTTIVHLAGGGSELRTGMSCRAEILIDKYQDVVFVPLQAVLLVNNTPTVYVKKGRKTLPRQVETGQDNNRMIHIISGLEPGEEVLLTPPFAPAALREDTKEQPATSDAERNGRKGDRKKSRKDI